MKSKVIFVLLLMCGFTLLTDKVNAQPNTSFRYPLETDFSPSQDFGVWNSVWKGYHLAEDIPCDPDTPVYPIGDGIVKYADIVFGYTVIIEYELPPGDPDGEAVCSIYYHLKRPEDGGLSLTVGTVSREDPIGFVSGRWDDHESNPHLHFGIRKGRYQTGTDTRTEKWYYPGYTAIYKNEVRQDDQNDPVHQQILSEWFNPTTDSTNGIGFIESHSSAQAEETITNETIIEFTEAGLSDTVIINTIKKSPTSFDLSPKALINLKKKGVSNKIIETMQAKTAPKPSTKPSKITSAALPKSYGLYLVEGNKLTELNPNYQGDLKEQSDKIKFLLFVPNAGHLLGNFHLVTLKYLNRKIVYDISRNFNIADKKVSKLEKWGIVFCPGEHSTSAELSFEPLSDKPEMVYLSPKKTLLPGAYALITGNLSADKSGIQKSFTISESRIFYKFSVGKNKVLSSLEKGDNCVNVVYGSKKGGWDSWNVTIGGEPWRAVRCSTSEVLSPKDRSSQIEPTLKKSGPTGQETLPIKRVGENAITPQKNNTQLVVKIQTHLSEFGYYKGNIDGLFGPKTSTAIKSYQLDNKLTPDGKLSDQLLSHLKSQNEKTAQTQKEITQESNRKPSRKTSEPKSLKVKIEKVVDNIFNKIFTHRLPWREVRLKNELAGSPEEIRALSKHATKVLKSRGVGVSSGAEYIMRVAEKGDLVGIEVLSPEKVAVADVTVRYKAPKQTRYQAIETAIFNLKLKDGVAQ